MSQDSEENRERRASSPGEPPDAPSASDYPDEDTVPNSAIGPPPFEEDEPLTEDWEETAERDEREPEEAVTDVAPPGLMESLDDVHRGPWDDFGAVLEETAVDVVDELLRETDETDYDHDDPTESQLDDSTLSDLHEAFADPTAPPEIPQEPRGDVEPTDTFEIELAEDAAIGAERYSTPAKDRRERIPDDPFDATGIEFVDVDTGEVLDSADVPTLDTGFYLLEEEDEEGAEARPGPGEEPLDEMELAPGRAIETRHLGIRLHRAGEAVELGPPWAQFLGELRSEILEESDHRRRAAYLYLVSEILGSLRSELRGGRTLNELVEGAGAVLRSGLLQQLATNWREAGDGFFEILGRLESLDEQDEGSMASARRSSIVMERLLSGGLSEEKRARLRELLLPPETFPALVVRTVDAHRDGDRESAVRFWQRLSSFARGPLRESANVIAAYWLQGTPTFFDTADAITASGEQPRDLLLMMQSEAIRQGDRIREAKALKRLIGQDVRTGQTLQGSRRGGRGRLKRETAARLFRLSTLLGGLDRLDIDDREIESLDTYNVLRDAVSLHASNLLYLRRLERAARERGDWDMVEKALASQAAATEDPQMRAVLWERLASNVEMRGGDPSVIRAYLDNSLDAAPDCLPALISLGQFLIRHGKHAEMVELRGEPTGGESRDLQVAWRRAELLEHIGGDPEEMLELYQEARNERPDSVHLFFCLERALARVGDWRRLAELYDSATAYHSQLSMRFEGTGFDAERYRLAAAIFLVRDDYDYEDIAAFLEQDLATNDAETEEFFRDESVLWRSLAIETEEGRGREAMARLEVLLQLSSTEQSAVRDRALLWYSHVLDEHLGHHNRAVHSFRELYDRGGGPFMGRYALLGLLRAGDYSWLAGHLLDTDAPLESLGWHCPLEDVSPTYRGRLAAELYAHEGEFDRALRLYARLCRDAETEEAAAVAAERALVHALRWRRWARAIPFLPYCFGEETPGLADFVRYLGVSLDDAREALARIDESDLPLANEPRVMLCELELALRARESERVVSVVRRALETPDAGSVDFRSFLLIQALLAAEWSKVDRDTVIELVDELWSLLDVPGISPILLVATSLRIAYRYGLRERFSEWSSHTRQSFMPAVAEALLAEAQLSDEVADGAQAAEWFAQHANSVPQHLHGYYTWMSGVLDWMHGDRNPRTVQELADSIVAFDAGERVGAYLLAVAYRGVGMHASCERQLQHLQSRGHSRPVQDWSVVRTLMHLGLTQNRPDEAMEMLESERAYEGLPWRDLTLELLDRALRRSRAVERLRKRSKRSAGAESLQLEIAELLEDGAMYPRLAEEGNAESLVHTELMAAHGERPNWPERDVTIRYSGLCRSIETERKSTRITREWLRYLHGIQPVFVHSPWCPLRAVDYDLGRLEWNDELLDELVQVTRTFRAEDPSGAELRLVVARLLHRMNRSEDAIELMPETMSRDLVSLAWAMFDQYLDPFSEHPRSKEWTTDLWEMRRAECRDSLKPELAYEFGRCSELNEQPLRAIDAYRRALTHHPTFLPAQVAAGRLLIEQADWEGLASLWEGEMQNVEEMEALASLAFRVGFLHERRLRHHRESEVRAEGAYLRVLRVRPNHLPTLQALLEIAYRQQNWEAAARYLEHMISLCSDVALKNSYHLELATIREHHLEDVTRARASYRHAQSVDVEDADALFGLLRTDARSSIRDDTNAGHESVAAIESRMDAGVSEVERTELARRLFVLSHHTEEASEILKQRCSDYYPAAVVRLARAVEAGQLDAESLNVLRQHHRDSSTQFLVQSFERTLGAAILEREKLKEEPQIGTHPLSEGRLVHAMKLAGDTSDMELHGLLAAIRARRSSNMLIRSTELTWMAATMVLRDDFDGGFAALERVLGQFPNYLPAVKLAKMLSARLRRWEPFVRWHERDAQLTKVDEIAATDRLRASEVQRRHLGDFDAAIDQLQAVLSKEPDHDDAFARYKEILLTKQDYGELLDAYERRLDVTDDDDEACALLNEMADIALNHLRDRASAIHYLSRSLDRNPRQLRRLRVIAELYEAEGEFARAVTCHRAAAELTRDDTVLPRLWRHVGQLCEKKLERFDEARTAYQNALEFDPKSTPLHISQARVCERLGDLKAALGHHRAVLKESRDEKALKIARVGIARILARRGTDPANVIAAMREVLIFHPDHEPTVNELRERLVRAGRHDEIEDFFRGVTHDSLARQPRQSFVPHFEFARKLGHADRAFCLASLAEYRGDSTPEMDEFHSNIIGKRRWPTRPLPADETGELFPSGMLAPFLELLRMTNAAVIEGFEKIPGAQFARRQNRLREPAEITLQLAERWPLVFNTEARDLYIVDELPGGSAAWFDNGARIVLGEVWRRTDDPTELLVGLGRQLAAWSMGVGAWSLLEIEAQCSLFIAIVSNFVPGWSQAQRSHLPEAMNFARVRRWLERRGERVGAYALEISGRFGTAGIEKQFALLQTATERLATVVIDDPGRALASAHFGDAARGQHPPWLFFFESPTARIRRAIGVAVPEV